MADDPRSKQENVIKRGLGNISLGLSQIETDFVQKTLGFIAVDIDFI